MSEPEKGVGNPFAMCWKTHSGAGHLNDTFNLHLFAKQKTRFCYIYLENLQTLMQVKDTSD